MFSISNFLFSDLSVVLFGTTMLFFGAAITLSLLLKQNPRLHDKLAAALVIIFILLLGMITLDLFGAREVFTFESYKNFSASLATHRLLIIQLPFVLIAGSIITLYVYGEKIVEDHAREYRYATTASIWISFLIFILIGFESLV